MRPSGEEVLATQLQVHGVPVHFGFYPWALVRSLNGSSPEHEWVGSGASEADRRELPHVIRMAASSAAQTTTAGGGGRWVHVPG